MIHRINLKSSLIRLKRIVVVLVVTIGVSSCGNFDVFQAIPSQSGGDTSINDRSSLAFEAPASNLTGDELEKHLDGDITFDATFVTAPAPINPGLGPLFNNVACSACHINNGRGPPVVGSKTGLRSQGLVRISDLLNINDLLKGNPPVEGMGNQIQDHAIFGKIPEAIVDLEWEYIDGNYADGTVYTLRRPLISITKSNGDPLEEHILTSFRLPPPIIGLGLLEAISEETLLSFSDPDDLDGDGISGRPNYVWNIQTKETVIGRFGHKANTPNLKIQAAAAYFNDMGISSPLIPGDDIEPDIDEETLELTSFYTQTLAVPLRTLSDDPEVLKGEQLFNKLGCVQCHISNVTTGTHDIQALSGQTISPFTDLLLHDMGDGLADNRPDFLATGKEWRTSPLWGIGLTKTVMGDQNFLHDGRARTLEEAILWHEGEGQKSKDSFLNMNQEDRDALIKFLDSL